MAFGYIDPGSGSLVLQVILGGVAGAGVAGKLLSQKVRGRLSRSRQEAAETQPVAADTVEQR